MGNRADKKWRAKFFDQVLKIPEENERPGKTTPSSRKKLIAADYNKNRRKYEWQVFTKNIFGEYAGSHDFEHLIEITKDGTRERTNFIRHG